MRSVCEETVQTETFQPNPYDRLECNADDLFYFLPYFRNSHILHIHHHLQAEVVFRPYRRLIVLDDFLRLKNDLWEILLRSCEKGKKDEQEYLRHIDIEKVGINVDYLIIAQDQNGPIGYASGTFITRDLFYINCAMTIPEYQKGGIGSIITGMLCQQAVQDSKHLSGQPPYMVCRTQNQKAARSLLRAMKNGLVSTEAIHYNHFKQKLLLTARFLHCNIDLECGVSRDVYPKGLPKGEAITDQRIKQAFRALRDQDACYVIGQINEKMIRSLLARYVSQPALHKKQRWSSLQ